MLKSFSLTHFSSLLPQIRPMFSSKLLCHCHFLHLPPSSSSPFATSQCSRFLSTNPTPYPLQYEMIINRPETPQTRRRPVRHNDTPSPTSPELDQPDSLQGWVDEKLAPEKLASEAEQDRPGSPRLELDKAKRKYYNKRRKRMYGSDSDEDGRRPEERLVELKPEVVELPTLHRREEELYFYDAFAYPWEKEKHYKMVYQLEKKYFPDQCLDKAFVEPGQSNSSANASGKGKGKSIVGGAVKGEKKDDEVDVGDNRLVFFEEKKEETGKGKDLTEKKVEEFFKGLKKASGKDGQVEEAGEPYFTSRRTGLPPTWDGPHGTVLLVNKPKGDFTNSHLSFCLFGFSFLGFNRILHPSGSQWNWIHVWGHYKS